MPWIKVIPEDEATGEVNEAYEHYKKQRGVERVGGPSLLHSLNPRAMRHINDFFWEIHRGDSRLSFAQREMIATVTSLAADCRY